ncbi:MAG: hypothetical protein HQK79_15065 [Desulfobacterales bacterium]|nr:hypothetical protein [Desulfobacterales bacterium]MBF0395719.1 hypothetical protein [Desulfobacterales bacterium]
MKKDNVYKFMLDSMWNNVRKIREQLDSIFSDTDEGFKDACKMVASELIENSIKYGQDIEASKGVELDVIIEDGKIVLKSVNRLISMIDFDNVKFHIDRINASDNPEELYISRLQELMDSSKHGQSQLGLYRIAYEGEFKLDYNLSNNVLIVTASRNLPTEI